MFTLKDIANCHNSPLPPLKLRGGVGRAFSLLLLLVSARIANAQDDSIYVGEIETKIPSLAHKTPSAFSTIIRTDERSSQFTTVPEILSEQVGTTVRSLGSAGQFSTISIRGSSAEQVPVYIDGIRVNSGAAGAADMATLPMNGVEHIEVVRGGGNAMYGGDAIGGAVNIVTKKSDGTPSAEANIAGGSFLTFKANGTYAGGKDDKKIVLGLNHFQSRGDYTFRQASTTLAGTAVGGGGTFRRHNNAVISDDFLLKYDAPAGEGASFNVTNDFFWTDRHLPGTEAEATLLSPTNPLEASQRIYRDVSHIGVKFDDLFTPQLSLAMGINNTFEHARFDDPTPAVGAPINRTTINDSINPYMRWGYDWGAQSGSHALGLMYEYRRDIYNDSAGNATTSVSGLHERSQHQLSVQDEWHSKGDRVAVQPVARVADADGWPATLSGKLGVRVRPLKPLQVKANIEAAHRYPTFNELYYPDEGYLRGNPDLDKESSLNWDAGVRAAITNFVVEAAWFQNRINNSILFVPISATTIQPINTFAARAEGVELSFEATPFSFARATGNYTWLKSHFASTGLQLPGRPRHSANARVELFHNLSKSLAGRLFADIQWMGRTPVNVANSVFLAARTTLDTGATLTLTTARGTRYFTTIEAKDLTNVQAYDSRGFPLPRRAFYLTVGARWS